MLTLRHWFCLLSKTPFFREKKTEKKTMFKPIKYSTNRNEVKLISMEFHILIGIIAFVHLSSEPKSCSALADDVFRTYFLFVCERHLKWLSFLRIYIILAKLKSCKLEDYHNSVMFSSMAPRRIPRHNFRYS